MEAFSELVRSHQKEIWCYLRVLGCEPAQADDLTQETFLAVLRRPFEQYSRAASAAYLRKVAKNRFLMAIRAARARPSTVALDQVEPVFAAPVRRGGGPYFDALESCLQQLPDRTRNILTLRYKDRLASKDIASRLRIKAAHVDTITHRAKAALKRCIGERLKHE